MTNGDDMDFSDEDRAEYEQEYQDLSEKDILIGILTELQQLRLLLSNADTGTTQDAGADARMYECQHCDATVKAGERERHAESAHKAPPDMAESLFEEQ